MAKISVLYWFSIHLGIVNSDPQLTVIIVSAVVVGLLVLLSIICILAICIVRLCRRPASKVTAYAITENRDDQIPDSMTENSVAYGSGNDTQELEAIRLQL